MAKTEKTVAACTCKSGAGCRCNPCTCKNCNC
jgi:hypothetical protein